MRPSAISSSICREFAKARPLFPAPGASCEELGIADQRCARAQRLISEQKPDVTKSVFPYAQPERAEYLAGLIMPQGTVNDEGDRQDTKRPDRNDRRNSEQEQRQPRQPHQH